MKRGSRKTTIVMWLSFLVTLAAIVAFVYAHSDDIGGIYQAYSLAISALGVAFFGANGVTNYSYNKSNGNGEVKYSQSVT